jgi:parvulin-like peptidyl-prolyl isomerase
MTDLVRIDDEVITADDLVKILKLTGRYESIIDDIVKDKLAVHAARKQGISLSAEEIQERADQLRRVKGLHRAVDMNNWLDSMKISLDDLEKFIVEMLYHEKIMEQVVSDGTVEEYFKLNSPKFDSIEISHILLDSEGKARELMAILEEEPESFAMMAREHSLADTGSEGGYVGKVMRGSLHTDVEAKVFNAAEGELLGPFSSADETCFEIFTVNSKLPATLDTETDSEVRRLIKDQWLAERAREHGIEVC